MRPFFTYLLFIAVFIAAILAILQLGGSLPSPSVTAPVGAISSAISVNTLRTLLLQAS